MATKLTEEEKQDIEDQDDNELRILIEESVRKRMKCREDKKAYVSAANEVIWMQEARMEHAATVLDLRRAREARIGAVRTATGKVSPPPPPH